MCVVVSVLSAYVIYSSLLLYLCVIFLNVHVFYKNYFLDTCEVEGVLFALRSKNK